MKKTMSLFLASILITGVCGTAAGCFRESGEQLDKDKTQLYISHLDAGLGREWIRQVGSKFAEDFANYSFETGKTGVQVLYNDATANNTDAFFTDMESDLDYIYLTEDVDYKKYSAKFADVTDVMNAGAVTGVDENGNLVRETSPISQKINTDMLNFLNNGSGEQVSYKATPFYLGIKTATYDKDLWSENRYFFSENGCPSEIVVNALENSGDISTAKSQFIVELNKIKNGQESEYWWFVDKDGCANVNGEKIHFGLSAGPDGKRGTFDDGLPATYDEFYLLLDKMSTQVTPFVWPGSNPGYADNLITSMWQNNEGVDNLKVHYSLNGTLDNLVKIENGNIVKENDGKVILESVSFTGGEDNGFEMQRSVEKYYALQFAEKIAFNDDWTHTACYDGSSQTAAQSKFLTEGITAVGAGVKRNAILIDGCWWQQEAASVFDIMTKKDEKYSKSNRDFAPLPLPNSTVDRLIARVNSNEKNTIVAANDSYVFINGQLKEGSAALAVSKAFMSYLHNDKIIAEFTKHTGMYRNLDIEFDNLSGESLYTQNLAEYINNTNIIYPYSSNTFVNQNRQVFENRQEGWLWHTYMQTGGEKYYPISVLHTNKSIGVTGEKYFTGLYNYYKNYAWSKLY